MTGGVGVPSRTERGLDAKTVMTVVRDQFPEVKAEIAELLDEGLDFDAYMVDRE